LVFYKQGDHKTAVEYRQQALRALNQLLGQDHPWTQRAMGGRFISGDG